MNLLPETSERIRISPEYQCSIENWSALNGVVGENNKRTLYWAFALGFENSLPHCFQIWRLSEAVGGRLLSNFDSALFKRSYEYKLLIVAWKFCVIFCTHPQLAFLRTWKLAFGCRLVRLVSCSLFCQLQHFQQDKYESWSKKNVWCRMLR